MIIIWNLREYYDVCQENYERTFWIYMPYTARDKNVLKEKLLFSRSLWIQKNIFRAFAFYDILLAWSPSLLLSTEVSDMEPAWKLYEFANLMV